MIRRVQPHLRRGAVLVWVAVLLTILLAMTGLSIDGARLFIMRAFLQTSADVASLSGVIQLPDTATALARARSVLTTNEASAGAALQDSEVLFGRWDPAARTFAEGGEPLNALRMTASRDTGHSNPVPLFLLPILGRTIADVNAVSTAYAAPRVGGFYSGGFIGTRSVDVGGNANIDGYNIDDGPYSDTNSGLPGSVISNGSMRVHGNPVVTGDARPGVSYTQADIDGNPTIGGTISALSHPADLAPVQIPSSINDSTNNNNAVTGVRSNGNTYDPLPPNNNFDAGNNQTATVPSGNYYFNTFTVRGTVNITGPAKIRVASNWQMNAGGVINISGGPVEFYVEGDATLAGQGIVNTSQDPRNLTIYSTGSSVRWEGGSAFHGYIYAPTNTAVSIRGSADFFGGAVGRDLEFGGTGGIHSELGFGFSGPNRPLPVLVN